MLRKNLFLVLAILWAVCHAHAQQLITLPEEPLPVRQDSFKIETVIDLRHFRDHIGVIQKGLGNKKVEINFPDGLASYVDQYLERNYSSTGEPLILIISDFWVGEETKALSEKGFVEATMTLCRRDTTGQLRALYTLSDRVQSGGMDVTAAHPNRIRQWLTLFLGNVTTSDWKKNPGELYEIGVELNAEVASLHEMQTFPAGLYQNVGELLKARPGIAAERLKISDFQDHKIKIKNLVDVVGKKRVFAYSDGQQLYISSAQYQSRQMVHYFAPVRETGRFFLIEDYLGTQNPAANGMMIVGIGGGLIGGAIAGLAASQMNANAGEGFIIDFKTGKTYVCNDKGILEILEEFTEAKERYLGKKKRRSIAVWRSCIVYLNRLSYQKSANAFH
ncbi:hypothetical protein BWI97_17380 [Siphonobacter sp. BAB-5405]|uniref:DUF6563 family protein n=1 Tax=Siphonobacter sp. BAB-5405 TaxID=1864825 RepID=UPI000C7F95CA|nr:DUF6563 family protein [Siphonobacter sp. BAB-5405]PMD94037.1 hypothetical protein BWI97_17380 [Siphonobacter sp. BAB-5405]